MHSTVNNDKMTNWPVGNLSTPLRVYNTSYSIYSASSVQHNLFFYHWVHEEVCPSPGFSLHEVGVRAVSPDLKRIRLANYFWRLDKVHKTCPVKWHVVTLRWIICKTDSTNMKHLRVPFCFRTLVLPHFALGCDINTHWFKSKGRGDYFHNVGSWRDVIHGKTSISSVTRIRFCQDHKCIQLIRDIFEAVSLWS